MESILEASKLVGDFMFLHDAIKFAYLTGCRRGELVGLTIYDCDLETNQITFRDTKNGSDHNLPIHKDLVEVIKRRQHMAVDEFMFSMDDPNNLLIGLRRLNEKLGIDLNKDWHSIRHSTATHLVSKGVEIRKIMGVMNHRSVNTTLRYAKVADKAKQEAIDLL